MIAAWTGVPAERARVVLALALPIVGGMLSQNVLNLVDTAMVGSLGADAVAGVGLASFVFFLSIAAITGLSSAVQAVAARRVGEGRPEAAAAGLHAALLVSVGIGLPLCVVLWAAAPGIFALALDDPGPREVAVGYYRGRLGGLVAVGGNFAFRGFFTGVSRPGLYVRSLLTMHVANVVVSYLLIFGVGGLPALGATGAGLGTAIASWIGTVAYVAWGWREARRFGWLDRASGLDREAWGTLSRLALPAALQQFLFSAGFTLLFVIVARIGTAELAAANVLINLAMVGVLPAMGLGLAASSLVGQALGRGDPDDAERWAWDTARIAGVAMALVAVPAVVAPDLLLGLFLPHDPHVVEVARTPLRLVGVALPPDAVGIVLLNALLGAGAARTVMRVAVTFQWGLFLPFAAVVGPVLGWGLVAVWAGQGVTRIGQAAVLARVWARGGWRASRV